MKQEATSRRVAQEGSKAAPQDLDDSDEVKLDSVLIDIVSTNIANKMSKSDPEYKIFKENYDKVMNYFETRFKYIPEEVVYEVFFEFSNRIDEVATIIQKNILEFCTLTRFLANCLDQLNPLVTIERNGGKNPNTFALVVESIAQIGNKLLNNDPQTVEIFFLEYVLDDLIEIMLKNTFKRNEMVYLIYCFVSHTTNSHLRVLLRLRERIFDKDIFIQILSRLFLYEARENPETFSLELYEFYFSNASMGLTSTSPITRTKCVTILSFLCTIKLEPILPVIKELQVMASDTYWELKGQILILCSNALLEINAIEDELNQIEAEKN